MLPFGNTVAVVYVTGAELLEALEASTFALPDSLGGFPQIAGMNISIDATKKYDPQTTPYPSGSGKATYYGPASINRVTINSVNGKAFDLNKTYAVWSPTTSAPPAATPTMPLLPPPASSTPVCLWTRC